MTLPVPSQPSTVRRGRAMCAALATLLPAGAALGTEPTRPLEQTIVVREAGPCIDQRALLDAVAAWLRTRRVDARLTVLVTRRQHPRPTLSFWVWRAGQPIAERHLPTPGERCEDVLTAVAFAVALAIDATILEASVVEPAEPAEPPAPAPRAAPPPAPVPARPTTSAGLWLGPSWIMSSGGVGPWLGVNAGGFVRPLWPLLAEVDAAVTPGGGAADLAEGRVTTHLGWLRLSLLIEPWPGATVSPALGLGGGWAVAWASAEPAPGSLATDDRATVALLLARGRLGFTLSRHLSVNLILNAGRTLPELQLRADQEPVASLGQPLVDAILAAGYAWP